MNAPRCFVQHLGESSRVSEVYLWLSCPLLLFLPSYVPAHQPVVPCLCPDTQAFLLIWSRNFFSTLSVFRSDLPDILFPPWWAAYQRRLRTSVLTELRPLTGENLRHCGKLMGEVL